MPLGAVVAVLVMKFCWPSTASALAPLALLAASLKRRTRLLDGSATHKCPVESTNTQKGWFIPFRVVEADLVLKSVWPSTRSASAPSSLSAAWSKRKTRLFCESATHSVPLESTCTSVGLFIPLCVVAAALLVKFG